MCPHTQNGMFWEESLSPLMTKFSATVFPRRRGMGLEEVFGQSLGEGDASTLVWW